MKYLAGVLCATAAVVAACSSDGSDAATTPAADGGTDSGADAAADPPPLSETTFPSTCTSDSDCTIVADPPCSNVRCSCASRAIRASAANDYAGTLKQFEATCESLHPGPPCAVDCAAAKPFCCGGTCAAKLGGSCDAGL